MTKMDLQGPSRTFEDSWVPIIYRGSTIGSDMPSALGLVFNLLVPFSGAPTHFRKTKKQTAALAD